METSKQLCLWTYLIYNAMSSVNNTLLLKYTNDLWIPRTNASIINILSDVLFSKIQNLEQALYFSYFDFKNQHDCGKNAFSTFPLLSNRLSRDTHALFFMLLLRQSASRDMELEQRKLCMFCNPKFHNH